jgi:hypothetical protein
MKKKKEILFSIDMSKLNPTTSEHFFIQQHEIFITIPEEY